MKKIVKLTESDLTRIVKRVIEEQGVASVAANAAKQATNAPTPYNTKTITPKITINCNKRLIMNSQLPKLDANANKTIIDYYCNK